jgi:hypothetical protein
VCLFLPLIKNRLYLKDIEPQTLSQQTLLHDLASFFSPGIGGWEEGGGGGDLFKCVPHSTTKALPVTSRGICLKTRSKQF